MSAVLTEVCVGDPPPLWVALGFTVDGGVARVGHVDIRLGGTEPGITGWRMSGLDRAVAELDGLPVGHASEGTTAAGTEHPNGIIAIDHVVLATPDLPRTVDALTGAGLELRRVRDAGRHQVGGQRQQAFFWLGEVILEVVGPAEPAGSGPATLWGLAFAGDVAQARDHLGDRLRPPRPAVQPGRMIATLDRSAGSTVPIVIMSPHEKPTSAPGDSAHAE